MKRTTIGIAVIIAIVGAAAFVGAVAIARAMLVPAPVEASAPPPPPIDPNLAAAHLAQALRFQTVSYGNGVKEKERSAALQEMHTWMERTYRYLHEAAPQEQFGESLLFVWRGTDENLAPVLSISYGGCESSYSSSDVQALESLTQQANAQGMTITAPSGDSGAADCDARCAAAAKSSAQPAA